MIICQHCKRQLEDDAKFCSGCGQPVSQVDNSIKNAKGNPDARADEIVNDIFYMHTKDLKLQQDTSKALNKMRLMIYLSGVAVLIMIIAIILNRI